MSKTWVFLWKKFGRQKARIKITRYSQRLTDDFSIFCYSLSECYFAGKGAALVLPPNERARPSRRVSAAGCDIQQHLQSMFYLLRPEETLKMVSYRQHKLMYLVSRISKVRAFWKLLQRDTTKVSRSSFFFQRITTRKTNQCKAVACTRRLHACIRIDRAPAVTFSADKSSRMESILSETCALQSIPRDCETVRANSGIVKISGSSEVLISRFGARFRPDIFAIISVTKRVRAR